MRAKTGPGRRALDELRRLLQVDDEWFAPTAHGFDWWPSTFPQHVTAEPAEAADGTAGARLTIETPAPPVLAGAIRLAGLAGINRDSAATLFAAVLREGKLVYVSRAFVHDGNLAWMPKLLSNAAILQMGYARRDRLPLRLLGELGPDNPVYEPPSAPPGSPPRKDDDELFTVFEDVYPAAGKRPVAFSAEDAERLRALAVRHAVRSTESDLGYTMEVPFDSENTAFLRVWRRWEHPLIGGGLRADLTFPLSAASGQANTLLNRLNEEEALGRRAPEPGGFFLGTWTWADDLPGALRYASFFPALVVNSVPGLPPAVALELLERARWAAARLHEPDLRPLWEPGVPRAPEPPRRHGLLGRLLGRRG